MSKIYIVEFTTYYDYKRDSEDVLAVFTEQDAANEFLVDAKKELISELGEPTTEEHNLIHWDNWYSDKYLTISEYEVNKELKNVLDCI